MDRPKFSFFDHRGMGFHFPWIMNGLVPTATPLIEKMRIARQLGYHGLGLAWWDLVSFYQERGDLAQIKQQSQQLNLPVTEYCCIVDGWANLHGPAREQATARFRSSLELAHAAGCRTASIGSPLQASDFSLAVDVFHTFAQYAGQLGMQLGIEFVGYAPQINSITSAWQLIDQAGMENTGLVIDSYHFFAGPSRLDDLKNIPPSRIFGVHLSDSPAAPCDPSGDVDRLMPGDGQLPLSQLVTDLAANGYKGHWHLECIQPRDFVTDMAEVAERGLCAVKQVVKTGLANISQ